MAHLGSSSTCRRCRCPTRREGRAARTFSTTWRFHRRAARPPRCLARSPAPSARPTSTPSTWSAIRTTTRTRTAAPKSCAARAAARAPTACGQTVASAPTAWTSPSLAGRASRSRRALAASASRQMCAGCRSASPSRSSKARRQGRNRCPARSFEARAGASGGRAHRACREPCAPPTGQRGVAPASLPRRAAATEPYASRLGAAMRSAPLRAHPHVRPSA
mmetsp:Transcript_21758/g.67477  ORF Transcript_21758/g.67477 Transcript_21758/m.67477 type:complete len:220 (+) Transcript_21758:281-940(+)